MIGANQCQHGRLAHKCQLCEDEEEIMQLKAKVRVLRDALVYHQDQTRPIERTRAALEATT